MMMRMWVIYSIVVILYFQSQIECKRDESVCVQHSETVGAYPCESRPTKEPLSLQYNKAQSDFRDKRKKTSKIIFNVSFSQ